MNEAEEESESENEEDETDEIDQSFRFASFSVLKLRETAHPM